MKRTAGAIAGVLLALATVNAAAGEVATELVSVSVAGTSGPGDSLSSRVSADGRHVVFQSSTINLVPGDTNAQADIFLRDRSLGTTERISVSSDGTQANYPSAFPSVSADGRYVAFSSLASNLVGGDTNAMWDVFVRDRDTGTTELISMAADGSVGNGNSEWASISADGRHVAFRSAAANLVANDHNAQVDVFVRDREMGTTTLVSADSEGREAFGSSDQPSISGDGSRVAFTSYAYNLVPDDTNGNCDVFVKDWRDGGIERVSVSSDEEQAIGCSDRPSISADGRFVAFQSSAANLVEGDTNWRTDVFVRDMSAGTTERVSLSSDGVPGNGDSQNPTLNGDGKLVAFQSGAWNLVPGDINNTADVFVRDLERGATRLASLSGSGTQATRAATAPSLAANGRMVAFESSSNNLVAGDLNGRSDVFIRSLDEQDLTPPVTSIELSGVEGNQGWFSSEVKVRLSATDEGGSGVREIVYWAEGAQPIDPATVAGDSVSFVVSAEGVSTLSFSSRDNAGNAEETRTVTIKVDLTAPVTSINLSGTDGKQGWFTSVVRVTLSVTDEGGSGAGEIVYSVEGPQPVASTTVAGDTASFVIEAERASTVSFFSRDEAGNVEASKTATIKIDLTPPAIEVTAPRESAYLLESKLSAAYLAEDLESGLASCTGDVDYGDPLDTSSPGLRTFTVVAEDRAGNTASREVLYQIGYGMTMLDATSRTVMAGATLPVRLVIVDDGGANRSSPAIAVKAVALEPGAPVEAAGSANADGGFRYAAEMVEGGGYIYNLSTKSLSPGSYSLEVTIAGDPTPHFVTFDLAAPSQVALASRVGGPK